MQGSYRDTRGARETCSERSLHERSGETFIDLMATTQESMLVCRVRTRLCAVPVVHVIETLRPLPVRPLPELPPFVTGVSLIRGQAVPVVDPGLLLAGAEPPRPARFLLLRAGERRVAFAVEAVVGVRSVTPAALAELPPLLRRSEGELVSALLTLDAEVALVLGATRVLGEAAFRAIQASGGAQ